MLGALGDGVCSSHLVVADDLDSRVSVVAVAGLETELVDEERAGAHGLAAAALAALVLLVAPQIVDERIGSGEGNSEAEAVLEGANTKPLRKV